MLDIMGELRTIREEIGDLDERRRVMLAERRRLIRKAVQAGEWRKYEIAEAAGVTDRGMRKIMNGGMLR